MSTLTPLSELVACLESGARPKGGVSADTGEIISLGAEHLTDDGCFSFGNPKRIPREFFEKMRSGRIKTDDILIVKDGATTGKTSFVGADFPFREAAVNEHVFRLNVSPTVAHSRYVFHYLASARGKQQILSDFRGATVGGIGRTFVEKVIVPLPTLNEQRRIAAILDKANALRRKRKRVINLLDVFNHSLFTEVFGSPASRSKLYPTVEVGSVTTCIVPGRDKPKSFTGSIPWITTAELNPLGNTNADNSMRGFLAMKFKKLGRKLFPKEVC